MVGSDDINFVKSENHQMQWLLFAVVSFAISSVLSLIIVLARIPVFADVFDTLKVLHYALVLHVDLGIIVWFFSVSVAIWEEGRNQTARLDDKAAFYLCFIGLIFMLLAPFMRDAEAILSDYILFIYHPLFMVGILCFFLGILYKAVQLLVEPSPQDIRCNQYQQSCRLKKTAAICLICALLVLGFNALKINSSESVVQSIQDRLWGVGHLLQIAHVGMLLVVWKSLSTTQDKMTLTIYRYLPVVTLLLLISAVAYAMFFTNFYRNPFYTLLMALAGVAILPVAIANTVRFLNSKQYWMSCWRKVTVGLTSMLFILGFVIALLIKGNNAMVPAHYHLMIGAITLAYFGYVFDVCDKKAANKLRSISILKQNALYFTGILLFVFGLIIADLPRKSFELPIGVESVEILGRILMGCGAILGLVAGMLFVWMVFGVLLDKVILSRTVYRAS